MLHNFFPAKKTSLLACFLSLGFLFCFTYFRSFGDPLLINGDTLFPERLFRDLFMEGGSLAAWTFPKPAYWPDLGGYFLIRFLSGDMMVALAAYAAFQATLLALALLYCIWPSVTESGKIAVPVFSVLAVIGVSMGHGYDFQALRMPAMHGLTIVFVVFCMGLLLRLAAPRPGDLPKNPLPLIFFLAVGAGYAFDGIFLIWFVVPSIVFLAFLAWRRELPRRRSALYIACILLACLVGALYNAAFKPPTLDHSAVHISFSKSLRAVPAMAGNILAALAGSPLVAAMCAATIAVIALFRHRMPRHFVTLGILMLLCTVSGIIANGHSKIAYILPVVLIFPLFGVAFLPMCLPERMRPLVGVAALLLLLPAVGLKAATKRPPFSPPLASCIDRLAGQYDLRNGVGTFWEASAAPLFTKSGIPFATSHIVYLTPSTFLMPSRSLNERYGMVILDTASQSFNDMEKMLFTINGPAVEAALCPDTDAKLYAYPEKGARLATVWDYLSDTGAMKTTRLHRDAIVWQGNAPIVDGMLLNAVTLRYRMNRIWILLHFAEAPEELAGKEIRIYAAGNRAKPAAQLAGKYLSKTGDSVMDTFWRRLAWQRSVTVGPETSVTGENGGTIVFLEGPSRDTKNLTMVMLEKDGKRTRIK